MTRGLLLGTDELYRERGYVGMSRGRERNHLYVVGATEIEDSTGHGPPTPGLDPLVAVLQALSVETDKRFAIDTGDPIIRWPIEDLVAKKHRLRRVLDACPPDRTRDIKSLTARRDELAAEIEPLAGRYNDLADRRLLGRAKRAELQDLGRQVGDRGVALSRVDGELRAARQDTAGHDQFQLDHAPDRSLLEALEHELDRHIATRVDQHVAHPPGYFCRILGPVPEHVDDLASWRRGASILEGHQLGADRDPSTAPRSSVLGSATEAAEMRARLEVIRHDSQTLEPPALDREWGLEL